MGPPQDHGAVLGAAAPVSAQQEDWTEALVGRSWEIYWKRDEGEDQETHKEEEEDDNHTGNSHSHMSGHSLVQQATAITDSVSGVDAVDPTHGGAVPVPAAAMNIVDDKFLPDDAPSSSAVEDEDDETSVQHADDWYEAKVLSISEGPTPSGSFVCMVVFEGEDDTTYAMQLDPSLVRPSARAWMRRTLALFRPPVRMSPELTSQPPPTPSQLLQTLPPDTATHDDAAALADIRYIAAARDFPPLPDLTEYKTLRTETESLSSASASSFSAEDWHNILELLVLVRQQRHLRTRLVPSDPSSSGDLDDKDSPTDEYLDHLVLCLHDLEDACLWYHRAWTLLARLMAAPPSNTPSIQAVEQDVRPLLVEEHERDKEQQLLSCNQLRFDGWEAGRRTLATLLRVDVSRAAARRKRKAPCGPDLASDGVPPSPMLSPSDAASSAATPLPRRTKRRCRRRRPAGDSSPDGDEASTLLAWLEAPADPNHYPPDDVWRNGSSSAALGYDVSDLRARLDRLVDLIPTDPPRWYVVRCTTLWHAVVEHVLMPLWVWMRRVERCLGDKADADREAANSSAAESDRGSSSGESYDDDEEMPDRVASRTGTKTSKSFVTYDEVEANARAASLHPVLKHLQLADLVSQLKRKLSAIDSFATLAWQRIGAVLDDAYDTQHGGDPHLDPVLQDLRGTLDAANSPQSPGVGNVEPLGKAPPALTRAVLQRAVECRNWYLRLVRASSSATSSARERTVFAEQVVSDFGILPNLPAPEGAPEFAVRLAQVAPRVDALAMRLAQQRDMYGKYDVWISGESSGKHTSLPSTVGEAMAAFQEFQTSTFIREAEERVAILLDVWEWEAAAKALLSNVRPTYADLALVKAQADLLVQGKSERRLRAIAGAESNPVLDGRIREFAVTDLNRLCEKLRLEIDALHAKALSWRDRAEAVKVTLRLYRNELAGEPMTSPKLPTMVDLKRIEDLVEEYASLSVDFTETFQLLSRILASCRVWSTSFSAIFEDGNVPFEAVLQNLRHSASHRPRGIIMNPTRHVVDALEDLLAWYVASKAATIPSTANKPRFDLLLEGIEIVAIFSTRRTAEVNFSVSPAESLRLFTSKVTGRAAGKALSASKLQSHVISGAMLLRMVDESRDAMEGYPLLSHLFSLWLLVVEDFTHQCSEGAGTGRTLAKATALLRQQPRPWPRDDSHPPIPFLEDGTAPAVVQRLEEFLREGEGTETEAREAIAVAKGLLRDCLRRVGEVRPHASKLKSLLAEFKGRHTGRGLTLDHSLEQQLDSNLKVFNWLAKAIQYQALRTRQNETVQALGPNGDDDGRVPWEVLVFLHDKAPKGVEQQGLGEFSYVVLRVNELHEAASAWQDDISNLTKLSLRGGKRRTNAVLSPSSSHHHGGEPSDEDDELSSHQIDLGKLAELSNNPVLWEVAMPRQDAIQSMLASTRDFELQLLDFLGKDYDGAGPDRAAYPRTGSLAGKDGSFHLLRLTGSPLYAALKASIASIAEVAGNVYADTPGKATFDWVCRAVSWIDALRDNIVAWNPPQVGVVPPTAAHGSKLVLPSLAARKLLSQGETILLNVPDDLRKTLRRHKVYVSANNKDGKLTVKSNKGGAQHAVGVTAIRWCPFLFESLKADVAKLDVWQHEMGAAAAEFVAFSKHQPDDPVQFLLAQHKFEDVVSELLYQAYDMVVSPPEAVMENGRKLLQGISIRLAASTPAIAAQYAVLKYQDSQSVIRNRFHLLDALVKRQRLEVDADREDSEEFLNPKDGPFRGAARVLIQTALLKGVASVLGESSSSLSSSESRTLCAMRAWEIEVVLFNTFQTGEGGTRDAQIISPEYREHARALKRSLEDPGNIAFCLGVLTGSVTPETIARTSTLDLANPKVKEERARAAASHNVVLDVGDARKVSTARAAPSQIPAPSQVQPRPVKAVPNSKARTLVNAIVGSEAPASVAHGGFKKLSDLARTQGGAGMVASRPPPPPSLAASLVVAPTSGTGAAARVRSGAPTTNAAGGDTFAITVSSGTFAVQLFAETDPFNQSDGLLPEFWTEKGRLPTDEFAKFFRSKLEGGKWSVLTLRLEPVVDRDSRLYKRYVREYELRGRLAMFAYNGEGGKVFLVTPKFHRAARGVTLDRPASTYAVVLVRK